MQYTKFNQIQRIISKVIIRKQKPIQLKMSNQCILVKQYDGDEVFLQLIQKLQFLNRELVANQSFEMYYQVVGVKREHMIETLDSLNYYFKQTYKQVKQNKIQRPIALKLFLGVTEYLETEKYQFFSHRDKAIYLLQIQTKMGASLQSLQTLVAHQEEKSILNSSRQSYKHVWQSIEMVSQDQKLKIKIKEGYDFINKVLILTTNAILMENESQSFLGKKLSFSLSYHRYFVNYSTARLKSFSFYKFPCIKRAKQIWNIPQNGMIKQFVKLSFQNIVTNQKIYIPSRELQKDQFPDIHTPSEDSIKVRLLYYKKLIIKEKKERRCCDLFSFYEKIHSQNIDTVLIHMHGGGFIALSSRMMQSMTRKWAKQLKIPVFSIDYRKPPDHPFPTAINDCLTVYKFLIQKISHYMNIQLKHVYLAGDSAGGNLACSLTAQILINKLPIPKGIYLAYPPLDIRNKYTPSKTHSLSDPLLWPSMLLLILKQYLGGDLTLQQHPLASPLLLTQSFAGGDLNDKRFPLKWPKTFISVGKKDSFYDNSLILMQKLKQSHVECYCRVYPQFRHGYLSTMILMKQSFVALQDSIKDLKVLIYGQNSLSK